MLVFEERGNPKHKDINLLEQRREAINSTHMMPSLGLIDGRQLSFHHSTNPFPIHLKLKLLLVFGVVNATGLITVGSGREFKKSKQSCLNFIILLIFYFNFFKGPCSPKKQRILLNFAQTENLKITDYQIKMLELFQNNNTSVQCLLGDHGS